MTVPWIFRDSVNNEQDLDFLLCVVDIVDTLNDLRDATEATGSLTALFSARRISISLRKLLLDGNGYLLKSCFSDPNLHPLKAHSQHDRPITFVQKFNRPTMELGFSDGKRTTVEIPEYEQRTIIHSLYGLRHENGQTFTFEMPFDIQAPPIKFKAWINIYVLQADEFTFTAKDLLRGVANNEGAHSGENKRLAIPYGSNLTFDNLKNTHYRAVNAVKFGGLSYAHNFVICTGLYIAIRSRTIIDRLPFVETSVTIVNLCKKIDNSPTTIHCRGQMENQTYHSIVLGTDLKVRPESLGGYSTLMKIP